MPAYSQPMKPHRHVSAPATTVPSNGRPTASPIAALACVVWQRDRPLTLLFAVLTALLWVMHRANIGRLLGGTEAKIGSHLIDEDNPIDPRPPVHLHT